MRAFRQISWLLCLFWILSLADLFLTYYLLHSNPIYMREINPLAAQCLARFGWTGIIAFKSISCITFGLICLLLTPHKPKLAKILATTSCLVVGMVVLYSAMLFIGIIEKATQMLM
jgi:hypothetical protein